jgi:hypothetical protein
MGHTFSLDVDHDEHFMSDQLSALSASRAIVGRNLRVALKDGRTDFIEAPLARFMVQEEE